MSPAEIQARAAKRFSARDYAGALQFYVAAVNAGGPAAQFRTDVARLPLSQLSDLPRAFQAMNDGARKRYLTDAGLPQWTGEHNRIEAKADHAFRQALARQQAGDEAGTLEALREAEDDGFDPIKTREIAGAVRLQAAAAVAQEDPGASVDAYIAALRANLDVAVLASLYGTSTEVDDDMPGYRASRQGLAAALYARGQREADNYTEAASAPGQPASPDHTLESAVADLRWAADMAADPGKVQRRLAELLWTAGRQDEARQAYDLAGPHREAHVTAIAGVGVAYHDLDRAGAARPASVPN